jgi:hypothetical protein
MSLSQATLVSRIRLHLGELDWETTGSAVDATTPYIAVALGEEWASGNIGEFFSDGDSFRTSSISGDTLTTVRSYHGSTGAAHGAGSRILKDPRFRWAEITNAISSVIQTLPWPRVYKTVPDTITPDAPTTVWYGLSDTALGLVRVRQLVGVSNEGIDYYSENRGHLGRRVIFRAGLPAALATNTAAVRFPDGFADSTNTVYVDYATRILDTVTTGAYADLTDGDAIVEAIIFGAVALLQDSMELRKPRRPSPDAEYIQGGQLFESRYRRALSHAERDIRALNPLLDTWKGPS